MTPRQRFIEAITFGNPDKVPLMPGGPRESTKARWVREGMPAEKAKTGAVSFIINEVLGIDCPPCPDNSGFFADFRMRPQFEEKVLAHENGVLTIRDWMGCTIQISDAYDASYIRSAKDFVTRKWLAFPVYGREDWEKLKWRYNADDPARLPHDLIEAGNRTRSSDAVISLVVNGPFWQAREWMGMENLCMAFIDDPGLVKDMFSFWTEYVDRMLNRFLPYVHVTYVHYEEDMAYKAHSMISPAMTREYIQPA